MGKQREDCFVIRHSGIRRSTGKLVDDRQWSSPHLSNESHFDDDDDDDEERRTLFHSSMSSRLLLLPSEVFFVWFEQSCKQEYKSLVNRYKREWVEQGSSNRLKLPLAKYIWIQLKAIYQAELTFQLNESRKKLTEFCLRLETVVNVKSPSIETIAPYVVSSFIFIFE